MSSNQKKIWRRVLQWVAGGSSLIYVLSRFAAPTDPPSGSDLKCVDHSWKLVLDWAFKHHQQFGRDIIFPYGPLGFLVGGCDPVNYPAYCLHWTFFTVIIWLAGWQLARHFSANIAVAWLWFVLFVGLAGLPVEMSLDVRLLVPVVLLVTLHFFVEGRLSRVAEYLLALALGGSALVKFSTLVMGTGVILILAADEVIFRRRFPKVAGCFCASIGACWLLDGQQANGFWPYLTTSWQLTSGYTEAMMTDAVGDLRNVIAFWLAATAVALPLVWVAAQKQRRVAVGTCLSLFFVTFLVFKHGYVRHDIHVVVAVLFVLLLGLAGLAVAWPELRHKPPRYRRLGILLMVVIGAYGVSSFDLLAGKENLFTDLAKTWNCQSLAALNAAVVDRKILADKYGQYLAEIRDQFPVPPLTGTVDYYFRNQAALLAAGLQYCPRPIFQSYSAYTPVLERGNAAFLKGDRAPENILLSMQPIDMRFPSLDDSLSWPELLTRYDLRQTTPEWVRLQHSSQPRTYHLTPVMNQDLVFGQTFSQIPTNGLIWAELEIDPTLSGKLASLLYKPSTLWMLLHLRNGTGRACRIVPQMAGCGFLLSPFVENNPEFASLMSAGQDALAGQEIVSLAISAYTETGTTSDYESPLQLRLYRLELTPLPNGSKSSANPAANP
jgi:hypothetical protein